MIVFQSLFLRFEEMKKDVEQQKLIYEIRTEKKEN